MTDEQITIGELSRRLERMQDETRAYRASHHAQMDALNVLLGRLSEKFDHYIGPVAVLQEQAEIAKEAARSLTERVSNQEKKIAQVWGVATAVGFIAGLLPAWLKNGVYH